MLRYQGFHGANIEAPPCEDFVSRDTGKIYKVVFICEGYRGKLLPAYKLHDSRVIIKEIFKSTD